MAINTLDTHRTLNVFMIGFGFVGLVLFLIVKGQMMLATIFSLLPIVAIVSSNRRTVFTLALFSSVAALGVPGIRVTSTSLAMMLQVALLVLFVRDFLMRQEKIPRTDRLNFFLLLFLGNMVLTAAVRGFGLYKLGGDMIGGMVYIQIILSLLFLWYLRTIKWTPRQVTRIYVILVIGSMIPFFAQMAVVRIPALMPLTEFFVFSLARVAAAMESQFGGRYETAVNFSYFLICSGVILSSKRQWGLLLAFGGVALLLLSGFRRYSVLSIFVLMLSSVMLSKNRFRSVLLWGLGCIAGVAVLYSMGEALPHNVQRALSFLPGIGVAESAMRSGEGSFEWRMDIYRLCLEELPKNLLVGKGMLLRLDETLYSLSHRQLHGVDSFYAFFTHNYHNGFFELMLDFGVVGFLSFFLFSVGYLNRVWKYMWSFRDDSMIRRIMVTTWVVCVALLVDFFLVRGEFPNFLAPFLIFFGMMILAHNALIKENAAVVHEKRTQTE